MSSRFTRAHGWTGVPKNAIMGTLGHGVCNTGKKGYSGVTKEPCYKCAEGAGGQNWPKRKKGSHNPDSQVN